MRKLTFLLALLCILALAGAAQAVTLEQGWYAQIRGVLMEVYDQDGAPIPWGGGLQHPSRDVWAIPGH